MCRYFVSYNVNAGGVSGFGNTEITTSRPYATLYDIEDLQRVIEKEQGLLRGSVTVLNFILLSSDEAEAKPNT